MINNNIKNENGVTLITLVITILVLVIITASLATNAYDSLKLSRLTKLDNDIKSLSDRVAAYYVQYEELPVVGNSYTRTELASKITDLSNNDGDEYYTIDVSLLDNLSLNYGKEYLSFGEDRYIINTESHMIYYYRGITYKGVEYHTVGSTSTVTLDYN